MAVGEEEATYDFFSLEIMSLHMELLVNIV